MKNDKDQKQISSRKLSNDVDQDKDINDLDVSNDDINMVNELENLDQDFLKEIIKVQQLKHRSLCKILDYQIKQSANEQNLFVFSEGYNGSLYDLYRTNKNENMEFTQEQLIDIAFQILMGINYLNQKGYNFKGMMRMENINFDEMFEVKQEDMLYLPKETIMNGQLQDNVIL
ncbi:kinase r-like protein [Stylonychia lemnae]|uniref:Kinase r-like protein n=1 Tax=Stylonychia lemnae TaxID=5949 RepID=A0A078BBZ6_STYLE|nr:kinase r-like protein [Stylonychia lemnae]|eukprot:CDW91123.1 kinase r-like protein [Stylonychia lemnae]